MRHHAASLPRLLLDILFPGRCLLCGTWLLFEGAWGSQVCEACVTGLSPIAGPRCRVCSMPLSSEDGVCTRCRETRFAFEASHSLFAFEGEMKDLIHQYKFHGRTRIAELFAFFLADAARRRFPDSVLVPVPPRPEKWGYDHIGRIVRILEARHGMRILRILDRKKGLPQKSLDFEERRRNLVGAIRVRHGSTAPDSSVLLDDVFTTGATLDACAHALKEAGGGKVQAITLAIDM